MATTIKDYIGKFRTAGMLLQIIMINVGVFLALRIVALVMDLGGVPEWKITMLHAVEMPSSGMELLVRPWTVVTYMFAQYDVLHILFNMLWLYWFGRLFLEMRSPREMLTTYLTGGITGAAAFFLAYNILPGLIHVDAWLIGASAAVIAIVVATTMLAPDFRINLLFFGPVALKWIAVVTICLDLISIVGENAGGHISHLGGALAGLLIGLRLRRGYILFPARAAKPKAAPKRESKPDSDREARLDAILDKIKRSGHKSLTAEERDFLFNFSRKND